MEKEKDLRMIINKMERIRRKEGSKQTKKVCKSCQKREKNNQRANKYCNSPNAHSHNHYSKVFFIVL